MGLQAAEIRLPKSTFWGVQYHPEYSIAEIAAMARRYGEVLIRDGLVKDPAISRDLPRSSSNSMTGRMMRGWHGASVSGPR